MRMMIYLIAKFILINYFDEFIIVFMEIQNNKNEKNNQSFSDICSWPIWLKVAGTDTIGRSW